MLTRVKTTKVALNRLARYFNTLLYLLQLTNLKNHSYERNPGRRFLTAQALLLTVMGYKEVLVLYVHLAEAEVALWLPVVNAANL